MPATILDLATSTGTARCHLATAPDPVATLVLGTGASGSVEATDLTLMPRQLPVRGITVVRVEQPWHVAGGRVVPRAPVLDAGWREVIASLRLAPEMAGRPLFTGGRSNGARVACRTAVETGAAGVVCFAFPLHPPGRPDQSRLPELLTPEVPRLVFQGERDAFGGADELTAELGSGSGVEVVPVPFADHSMRAARRAPIAATQIAELLIARTVAFCRPE